MLYIELNSNQHTVDQQAPASLTCFDLITSSLSAHFPRRNNHLWTALSQMALDNTLA